METIEKSRILASALGLIVSGMVAGLTFAAAAPATSGYPGWKYSGSLYILTTPEGANLPASASENSFPVLVRLHRDFFDFSKAKPDGGDLRFSTSSGTPLPYEIEEWSPAAGIASIWVCLPLIKGNARQEIRLYWGKIDAASESNGAAVFNESNGYLSIWHMNDPVKDVVGSLESRDAGTTPAVGIIGPARHFAGKGGIFCGDKITNYPAGSSSHSSEAWFRPEQPNCTVLAWGNEQAQGKVVMHFRSPPHVSMDCYFSDGNVKGGSALALSDWIHVIHTYQPGDSRIYVNGGLDGKSASPSSPLSIKNPARMWIGGWYNNYDFTGVIDEVRISKVVRSADWVRLQYENQKPLQTLVGPVVQPGSSFSVSPAQVTVLEGKSALVSAQAGGAQKIYWILKSEGRETLVAVDRFRFALDAGRVSGNKSAVLQFKAIYADETRTRDIPITILEDIPEPVFTLKAPAKWDGRSTIEVVPQIENLSAMQAKGAADLNMEWSIFPIAVRKEVASDKLTLHRAHNSGRLTVKATLSNGGIPITHTATIAVTEPKHDAWIAAAPLNEEKPQDNQFYARDENNEGTLLYNGTLDRAADSVFLRVYEEEKLYRSETSRPGTGRSYAFSVKLKPGLTRYKVEFGAKIEGREMVLHTVTNVVCGDAYLIDGQSNAVATDWGPGDFSETNEWIRSYGSMGGNPGSAAWGNAVRRGPEDRLTIGYWGFDLAKRLVEGQRIPICIINGAVGGTRIDQHQRNADNPEDLATIYGRLLWRARQAKLTHGIRGVLWHQGENDQGADGPSGGFGWETYRQYFIDLAAAWKQDFPNIQHYYVFQIWPKSCAMGFDGSDNRLREVQRNLPTAFSNLSIMSTLGIYPPGGCHYPAAGYAEFARLICPLVERDTYGKISSLPITPPNLKWAYYTSVEKDEIAMEFDQPMKWENALANQFYLEGQKDRVASGSAFGNVVALKLVSASSASKLTYLDSKAWNQSNLLRGENGMAALTFCEIPILDAKPSSSARTRE